jgi:hypothetical protein
MPRVTITAPDKNAQPYRFLLDRQTVSLGRGSDNDIVIDCGSVSGKHAEMVRREGGYELRDVGSTNGIKVDGQRMDVIPLRQGTTVKLGDVSFDFQLSDEEREALAREKPFDFSPIIKEKELPPIREEEAAAAPPRKVPVSRPVQVGSSGGGFVMVLVFLILAGSAFFVGMAIRHQKDTGRPLLEAISKRPAPAPVADGGAADAPAAVTPVTADDTDAAAE